MPRHELSGLFSTLRHTAGGATLAVGIISLVMNLLMLALPIYSLQVFDRVLLSRSGATLFYLTLIVVILITAYAFLEAIRLKFLLRLGNRFQLAFESRALDACVARSAKMSEPVTAPLRDLSVVRNFVASPQGIVALIDTPLALVFLVVVYFIHPILALAMVVGILLLMAVAVLTEWSTANSVKAANVSGNQAQARSGEIVRNAELVEAMGMREAILRYWRQFSQESLYHQSTSGDRSALLTAVGRWDRLVIGIAMTGLGAYLAIEDRITVGGMIAASLLAGRGLAPLESLIPLWRQLVSVRNAWSQLNEALQQYPRPEGSMSLPVPHGALSVEQVVYAPPGAEAPTVKGVSLQLPAGKQLGLVGPVSAGKTTLAKLICGIWKPRSGAVRLDNADVYQWNRADFGRHVGYLPQGAELFSGTVRDNIARFTDAPDEAVVEAAQLAGVHDMILRLPLGYQTVIGGAGATLSGGMRQRIGLARAMFGSPKLVVLDEPSANLDGDGELALLRALADMRTRGVTVILVTHKISLLKDVDLVGIVVDGQLKSFGPRDEVMKQNAPPASPTPTAPIAPSAVSALRAI
jgi:PrtD family type I secretion system ABC transporter